MSEELLQRGLNKEPEKIGKWDFYNIGATSIKALKENNIIRNIDYGRVIERKKVDGIIVVIYKDFLIYSIFDIKRGYLNILKITAIKIRESSRFILPQTTIL